MKKLFYIISVLVIVLGLTVSAYAYRFSDNFNDGNTDGWTFIKGNWSVVNGTLWETAGGDDDRGFVNNLLFRNQTIEVKVNTYSYGGVVFWYQDKRTPTDPIPISFVTVFQYGEGLQIIEVVDANNGKRVYPTYIPIEELVWHDLKVKANSNSGKIKIYVDGNYVYTYDSIMPRDERIGESGLYAGNSGAYFDDFSVRGVPECNPVPIPAAVWLLGTGLVGLVGIRRKFRN